MKCNKKYKKLIELRVDFLKRLVSLKTYSQPKEKEMWSNLIRLEIKWGHYNKHQKKNSEDHKDLHTKSIFHQTGGSERNGMNFRILYMACKT